MCDFEMAFVSPEMSKKRPCVVISQSSLNHKHGRAAGTCTIVPFSATIPQSPTPADVEFYLGSYWSLTKLCWAKCAMMTTISHDRLDLVLQGGARRRNEVMRSADMARLEDAIRFALGLA